MYKISSKFMSPIILNATVLRYFSYERYNLFPLTFNNVTFYNKLINANLISVVIKKKSSDDYLVIGGLLPVATSNIITIYVEYVH